MYNPMMDIDRRIEDLQRLKDNFNNRTQQPINIYNGSMPISDFKAQYLSENDKVEDLLVNCKTCFIDLKNKEIAIKETNGDITKYPIVLPKTPEELKIEELERKVKEYEQLINANNEIDKSDKYDIGNDDPTTKRTSKSVSK